MQDQPKLQTDYQPILPPSQRKRHRRDSSAVSYRFLLISAIILVLDQTTKWLARHFLSGGEYISVIGDFFRLTLVFNPGAAFSISFGSEAFNRIFFSVMAFLMIFLMLYMLKTSRSFWERLSFSMIIGGAVGNLIDRVLFGAVTDFLDFDWPDALYFERWPIFNIADSSIVCAVIILLTYVIFFEKRHKNSE